MSVEGAVYDEVLLEQVDENRELQLRPKIQDLREREQHVIH